MPNLKPSIQITPMPTAAWLGQREGPVRYEEVGDPPAIDIVQHFHSLAMPQDLWPYFRAEKGQGPTYPTRPQLDVLLAATVILRNCPDWSQCPCGFPGETTL